MRDLIGSIGVKRSSKRAYLIEIKAYTDWCAEAWFTTSDSYGCVEVTNESAIRRTMVASPAHLQEVLDECFRPLRYQSVDCMYRTLLWLAFIGVPIEDIERLRSNHFNLRTHLLKWRGREYPLPEQSIEAIHDCCYLKYFAVSTQRRGPTGGRRKKAKLPRAGGISLLRSIRGDVTTAENAIWAMKDAVNAAGYGISYERAQISGSFWRIYEREVSGGLPDYSEELSRRMAKWKPRTEVTDEKRHIKELQILRNIKIEYADWKAAFYPDNRTDDESEPPA